MQSSNIYTDACLAAWSTTAVSYPRSLVRNPHVLYYTGSRNSYVLVSTLLGSPE